MATFLDIKTAVSKRLLDPSNVAVSSEDVAQAINDAIAYWKFRRFWFNEVLDQVTLTIQDGTLPLTGEFLVSTMDDDGFNIEYSNMRYPLKKISQATYDGLFLNNGYGIPQYYARLGQTYQVYPLPDRAYTVNRHYLKDYASLVDDADTNDFTDNASRLITLWACANLSAELRQDDKMETYYRGASADEYRNLRVMSDKSNGSGKLTLHSNLL